MARDRDFRSSASDSGASDSAGSASSESTSSESTPSGSISSESASAPDKSLNGESSENPSEEPKRSPEKLWTALRRIFALSRPYRFRLYGSLVLLSIGSLVALVVPLGLRELLNAVFEEVNRGMLDRLTLGLIVLFLIQAVVSFSGNYLIEWTGERVVADLRQRVYQHLHRLTLRFFGDNRTGDLTSRLTNDVSSVRNAVTTALADMLTQSLSLIGSVVLMVVLNWRLSLIIFVIVPVVTIAAIFFGRKIRKLARNIQDRLADTTAIAEEALSSVRLVKSFARSGYEVKRYTNAVEELFEESRVRVLVSALFSSVVGLLFFSALVAIFWYGGTEVLAGRLTTGDLVAFIFYAFNIARSVGGMSQLYSTFNSAAGATERLFELLDTEPEIQDKPNAVDLTGLRGDIDFDHVTFAYDEEPVLRDITFHVAAGQTVAFVGPSGAGKSTTISLIPRFYDPQSGSVRIDGNDLRDVTVNSIRSQVAAVSQDVQMFNTSIEENIRYGKLNATDDEIRTAAEAANAHDFITGLPEGYESAVGERGVKLSGGQKQRIAIARALLCDARILLLDEATSSLDSASEALVQEALERLMEGRTTLIIAHRLSTVQDADRILVFEKGQIVQQGTHNDLFATDGLYRDLAKLQFREGMAA